MWGTTAVLHFLQCTEFPPLPQFGLWKHSELPPTFAYKSWKEGILGGSCSEFWDYMIYDLKCLYHDEIFHMLKLKNCSPASMASKISTLSTLYFVLTLTWKPSELSLTFPPKTSFYMALHNRYPVYLMALINHRFRLSNRTKRICEIKGNSCDIYVFEHPPQTWSSYFS